jgi:Flp pilus assembly protein TadB
MKFLSLFTKAPSHQRFNYTPRYWDPKKEERQEREARLRRELELEQGKTPVTTGYQSRIAGSFQAARKRSKVTTDPSAVLIRLGVLLFLVVFLMAFLTWGKPVIYSLFLFIPLYFYLKFKKR